MPLDYFQTVEVVVVQELFTQPLLNMWKFQCETPLNLAALDGLATVLNAWIDSDLAAPFSQDLTWQALLITSLDLSAPVQMFYPIDPVIVGGFASPSIPVNSAAMVRFLTGFLGPAGKGRTYLSGIGEADVDGNSLEPSFVAALTTAWFALTDALLLTPWIHVAIAGQGEPGPGTGVTHGVVAYQTDTRVHDMGRRLNN